MLDLIIIGAGPAGLVASIYASRYKIKHEVIGKTPGGLIMETDKIENWPGFKEISGAELAKRFKDHAESYGIKIKREEVGKVSQIKGGFEAVTIRGNKYSSKTLLIASGTVRRRLNVEGEAEFSGKGVHYCAICDTPLFRNKTVAVVGGGNSAVGAANIAAEFAKKVYLIYREKELSARPYLIEDLKKQLKIEAISQTQVTEIRGDKMVTGLFLNKPFQGKKELKLDGVFVEIGLIPETKLAGQLGLDLDKSKHIIIKDDCSTSLKGVYAAGDVTSSSNRFRQIITAAAEGGIAVSNIYEYLKKKNK